MTIASPSTVIFGDNLDHLKRMPAGSVDLIYIDPPFNTGKIQSHTQVRATLTDAETDSKAKAGFRGEFFIREKIGSQAYDDRFDDYYGFITERVRECHRLLADHGSLFFHIDYREVHYCKVLIDGIFGRASFKNEIIWSYDYGARSQSRWSTKHDTILWYAKDPEHYTFNFDAMDRIPYMAPELVGAEKAARGKTPTDVWWHTIVPTNSHERTGYPTQKPMGILRRIVGVHSKPGDHVLDCFAGSGTTGAAAHELGRRFTLIDANPQALTVMQQRFAGLPDITWIDLPESCRPPAGPKPVPGPAQESWLTP